MSLKTYAPVLDAVRGLGWPALGRVRGLPPGPHPSTARGSSAEFVEYRPYRPGDDPRKIDWKLLARTDRVYTRLSQEQARLPTVLVVDASASMAFPEETLGKWVFARQLAVALAAVARHRGDPVGLVVAGAGGTGSDAPAGTGVNAGAGTGTGVGMGVGVGATGAEVRRVPPQTRRTVLDEMMRALELEPAGGLPLAPALARALRLGERIALISDFLGDEEALLAEARTAVAEGREVYAIHIVDPGELDPDAKRLLVSDPEAPWLRRPISPRVREEYQRRFAEWREGLARRWRRAGAVYTLVVPGQEPLRRTVRRITTAEGGGRC